MVQSNSFNNKIIPNTFLIGAQKCATTSIYDWASQHPEICAPLSVKDYEYFTRKEFYSNKDLLSSFYEEVYNDEKIIFQGSVHYIYFKEALERIKIANPDSKFVLILRNPIERAISAYNYAVKFNYEDLPIEEAFDMEDQRIETGDIRTLSELTYKTHGLYYKQIAELLKIVNREQIHIILYEDITENPEKVVKDLFSFLDVNNTFLPEFRTLNNTGQIRNKWIQKIGFGDSPIRNFFIRKVLRVFLSEERWAKLRFFVIHANTKNAKTNYESIISKETKNELDAFFREDIDNLERFLGRDLSTWK
ncbi:sulfotransferase family protein [Winogradskyella sediminis]|uniref:sulfotransferase family protein n=1 Tax=Winogradskyella sediminis TaxID=1382466 RepID=UPI000E246EB5|nr:sulfotransferase [Winogradskyella sediminis]REG89317.1 sulfotransferase domain-containing protein [Winogradskyella sediminis]